ncbi:13441_t:CDS:2 [Acaulospora morrowiae]|uniref:13441_t:CDS:1 n=1 Tax=Acaulospora morrowiae TaxID=94023 RepID=A0A9N9EQP7_9GLOM|nr:13441_t:CDS:2 [Acaulospora morrowiae]
MTTTTKSSSKTMSERELNAKLTEIFNKIGQLDIAQQGIQELHELLMEHPECDVKVDAFLSSAGVFFQKYIRKALSDITKREMQNHGMIPKTPTPLPPQKSKDTSPTNAVNANPVVTSITTTSSQTQRSSVSLKSNKPPHKFATNRCSNSPRPTTPTTSMTNKESTKAPLDTAKISDSVTGNKIDLSELSPTTKALMDKISKETFEQTRFRLHHIFQYEKYKTGQKRASLPSLERYQSDAERLEYVKSILQTQSNVRRSTWPITQFEVTTSAISAN